MASPSGPAKTDNNTIYLVDIPAEQNSILKLYEYFSKFGKVSKVDVAHNGNPSAAKITFATNEEASAAFNSSEAVLNNRFIKMTWNSAQTITARQASAPASTPPSTPALTPAGSGQSDDTECPLCKKLFKSSWHRDWHMKRMHNTNGIICTVCNETFETATAYKKHCIVQHPTKTPQNVSPNKKFKYERAPPKFDQSTIRETELRIKIKSLKETLKETEKSHSKQLKSVEKKTKKRFEQQLNGLLSEK